MQKVTKLYRDTPHRSVSARGAPDHMSFGITSLSTNDDTMECWRWDYYGSIIYIMLGPMFWLACVLYLMHSSVKFHWKTVSKKLADYFTQEYKCVSVTIKWVHRRSSSAVIESGQTSVTCLLTTILIDSYRCVFLAVVMAKMLPFVLFKSSIFCLSWITADDLWQWLFWTPDLSLELTFIGYASEKLIVILNILHIAR
jgi:hypothetical protein